MYFLPIKNNFNIMNKFLYIFLIISLTGCEDETLPNSIDLNSCVDAGKKVKKVSKQAGFLFYYDELDEYRISHGIPGTYDSVIMGILCNLPEEWKEMDFTGGERAIFSGEYSAISDNQRPAPVGTEMYYLQLFHIQKDNN
jgi:hypothetical protein